ncbi:LysR family transcriptional regulator [Rhizobium lusitanum]|uniref:LysR family transcriptional regulator n=1 Tax=Rhizobium lusitanum TaxID=293958 RepID=UPI000DDD43CC|nr:LysR family transcriptional regulator [Rhizobium lusitanum]NTJ09052.1 LysR family transcriptional regulator [Rhizobium lusitanum]
MDRARSGNHCLSRQGKVEGPSTSGELLDGSDYDQLRAFVAVADALNFSCAAEQLGVRPSALSQSIRLNIPGTFCNMPASGGAGLDSNNHTP